jgi:hypothetical protein
MSRLLVQAHLVVPAGQFYAQDGRGDGAPVDIQDAPGTPKIRMGGAEVTTNAEGPEQLKPGGPWVGDTWCHKLTTSDDGSRAIAVDAAVSPPEPRSDDPNLFHYADRQWHVRRRIFGDNLLLMLDRDAIQDPTGFVDSSVDIAGHWVGLYKVAKQSFAALTQQDASYIVRAFNQQITNDTAALDLSTAETTDDLASLVEIRLQTILSSVHNGEAAIRDTAHYADILLRGHRISVEYKSRFPGDKGANKQIAAALGMLPDPFLWLIDVIYFHAERPDSPIADRPGGVSTTAPDDLYNTRYMDLRAVQNATPSAIARNLLYESARAFLTHDIALVPEENRRWQIVPYKPLERERWHRPKDFVSDLDVSWILAHRADQRHPQLIRHLKRVHWPLADGVAQDLAMVIGDDGGVNSTWVAQNPHLALLYSGWLSRIGSYGLLLPGEITGPLERAVWLFLDKKHRKA